MNQGQIRIIGGIWRGRKLTVPDMPNLRPTPNRVRETLFNWLSPIIGGAYCLDAFAGTGALGLEALSRGAEHVVMVEKNQAAVTLLQQALTLLKTQNAEVYCANVPHQLKVPMKLFDIVFLDPPYEDNLLLPTCHYLEEQGLLASKAYIYLEAKEIIQSSDLPVHWQLLKVKKAGQVAYHLAQRNRL